MKNFIKLILLLITFSFQYEDQQKYIPIDKYGDSKIHEFNKSNLIFTLDIRGMKKGDRIYLRYNPFSKSFLNSSVEYYWSKDNYKNVINITEKESTKNQCSGKITIIDYYIYCYVDQKDDVYNTLIIFVSYQSNIHQIQISHNRFNNYTIFWTIVFVVFIFLILFLNKIKKKRELRRRMIENNLMINNINNIYNPNNFQNPYLFENNYVQNGTPNFNKNNHPIIV